MASSLLSASTLTLSSAAVVRRSSTTFTISTLLNSSGRRRRAGGRVLAMGIDLLGDFGARDPFPAEIESNFGEKVIGNVDTVHKILIPTLTVLSLASRKCEPVNPNQKPLSTDDIASLLKKVVGWRFVEDEGATKLQCVWKVRDYESGVELINRIREATEDAGHYPNLWVEESNQVRAELWTPSIGGLSLNDFIIAAKIDAVKTLDLLPKKRVWA